MLVLCRKKGESIVVNNDITIVVVEIRGDKVGLGITAPREIPIHRREVYDAIQRQRKEQNAEPSQAVAIDTNTELLGEVVQQWESADGSHYLVPTELIDRIRARLTKSE